MGNAGKDRFGIGGGIRAVFGAGGFVAGAFCVDYFRAFQSGGGLFGKIESAARGIRVFGLFSVFGIFGAGIYWLAPIFAIETQQLGQLFPLYFEKVSPFLSGMGFVIFQSMDAFVAAVRDWMVGASSGIIGSLGVLFGGILTTFTIIVAAAFFSLEAAGIKKFILLAIPAKREKSF